MRLVKNTHANAKKQKNLYYSYIGPSNVCFLTVQGTRISESINEITTGSCSLVAVAQLPLDCRHCPSGVGHSSWDQSGRVCQMLAQPHWLTQFASVLLLRFIWKYCENNASEGSLICQGRCDFFEAVLLRLLEEVSLASSSMSMILLDESSLASESPALP